MFKVVAFMCRFHALPKETILAHHITLFILSIDEKRFSRSIDAIRGPVSVQPKEHAFSVCEARAPQCSGLALGPQDDVRDAHQLRSGEDNQRPQIGGVFSRRDQDCLRIGRRDDQSLGFGCAASSQSSLLLATADARPLVWQTS
jgi:hypothetical protein